MRKLCLFSSILCLWLLGWFTGRSLRPQLCISSHIVQNFIVFGSHHQLKALIRQCSAVNDSIDHLTPAERETVKSTLKRVALVDRVLRSERRRPNVQVVLDEDSPFRFQIQRGWLAIGEHQLQKKNLLEKGILTVALHPRVPNTYLRSILVDLAWAENFSSPNFDQLLLKKWASDLSAPQDYCRSSILWMGQIIDCQNKKAIANAATWMARPYLVKSLLLYKQQLPLSKRHKWFEGLQALLQGQGMLPLPPFLLQRPRDFASTQKTLEAWSARAIHKIMKADEGPGDQREILQNQVHEIYQRANALSLDLLVIDRRKAPSLSSPVGSKYPQASNFLSEFNHFKNLKPSFSVVWQRKNRSMWLPHLTPSTLRLTDKMQARQIVWLSCRFPTAHQLLALTPRGQRVLFIKACAGNSSQLHWLDLLQGGEAQWQQKARQLSFVSFYLPGLRIATRYFGDRLQTVSDWPSWLYWQGQPKADANGVYHPRSALDAIVAYRLAVRPGPPAASRTHVTEITHPAPKKKTVVAQSGRDQNTDQQTAAGIPGLAALANSDLQKAQMFSDYLQENPGLDSQQKITAALKGILLHQ